MFDLKGADPVAIASVLSVDPIMAPLVSARPGSRVPGGWRDSRSAVRAVLGQQTERSRHQLASRVVSQLARWSQIVSLPPDRPMPSHGRSDSTSKRCPAWGFLRPAQRRSSASRLHEVTTRICSIRDADLVGSGSRYHAASGVSATDRLNTSRCARSARATRSSPETSASRVRSARATSRRHPGTASTRGALATVARL